MAGGIAERKDVGVLMVHGEGKVGSVRPLRGTRGRTNTLISYLIYDRRDGQLGSKRSGCSGINGSGWRSDIGQQRMTRQSCEQVLDEMRCR
ncbi:MAG: hypothetical protein V8T12_02600 [Parabacteroides johnsonii]